MKKFPFIIFATGYILLIIGAVLGILAQYLAPYIFSVGVVGVLIGKFQTLPKPVNFRIRRLNNMLAVGGLLLMASAYLMFINVNIWAVTLLIAAFIDFYTSFRYPNNNDEK